MEEDCTYVKLYCIYAMKMIECYRLGREVVIMYSSKGIGATTMQTLRRTIKYCGMDLMSKIAVPAALNLAQDPWNGDCVFCTECE